MLALIISHYNRKKVGATRQDLASGCSCLLCFYMTKALNLPPLELFEINEPSAFNICVISDRVNFFDNCIVLLGILDYMHV